MLTVVMYRVVNSSSFAPVVGARISKVGFDEETKLVTKVLQLAGVGIKDYALAQAATQKEISKIQQEKQ